MLSGRTDRSMYKQVRVLGGLECECEVGVVCCGESPRHTLPLISVQAGPLRANPAARCGGHTPTGAIAAAARPPLGPPWPRHRRQGEGCHAHPTEAAMWFGVEALRERWRAAGPRRWADGSNRTNRINESCRLARPCPPAKLYIYSTYKLTSVLLLYCAHVGRCSCCRCRRCRRRRRCRREVQWTVQ